MKIAARDSRASPQVRVLEMKIENVSRETIEKGYWQKFLLDRCVWEVI